MSLSYPLLLPPLSLLPHCKTTREVQQLHSHTLKTGLFLHDPSITSTLLQSLLSINPNPSELDYTLSLFDRTPHPSSSHLYNALIRSHTQSHLPDPALFLFHRLILDPSTHPDRFTFPLVLRACAQISAIEEGEQIHGMVLKSHFAPADDPFVLTSLIRMYSQCGRIEEARRVFDGMTHRNVVGWNSMIDGFAKSGDMDSARRCFDEMPERNAVSWNAVIGGYVHHGSSHEALKLFLELQISGLAPDESTMVSVVSALSDLGLLGVGRRAHGYISRHMFALNGALGVALINMYTKCGSIGDAYQVFLTISGKNVRHWTSMIVGFAAHGLADASLQVFSEMLSSGVMPNYVTFIGVMNACSHGGLVDEGLKYFSLMRSYRIEPRIEHYGCLVDLLGRSGHLGEAMDLVVGLPFDPGFVIWGTLLAACWNHGNVEIAEVVARKLVELEPNHGSGYVLLSNLYGREGRWEDFRRTRRTMEERGVTKIHGFSWIEVDGGVHEFVAGDRFHVRTREIYGMLDGLKSNLRWIGCEEVTCDLRSNNEIIDEDVNINVGVGVS